jgi:hypothetical protein
MNKHHYLQFPIAVLQPNFDIKSLSDLVVDFACLHYGKRTAEKAEEGLIAAMVERCLNGFAGRHNYQYDRADHQAYLIGRQRLALLPMAGTFFDVAEGVRHAYQVVSFCRFQPYPTVRIRLDIWKNTFGDAQAGKAVSIREFRVLFAVYAAIGKMKYAKVTLERIRGLSEGYSNRAEFEEQERIRFPRQRFLSVRQIRKTLRDLEANRFFAKFTYNRGECFYSNGLNHAELREKVAAAKLRRHETVGRFRQDDQRASDEIREKKRRLGLLRTPDRKDIPFPCAVEPAQPDSEWIRQLKREIRGGQGAA